MEGEIMNWEKIKADYPKAYELFIKSDQYKIHDIYGFIETRIRDLFDFFDDNGIYANVTKQKYKLGFRYCIFAKHPLRMWFDSKYKSRPEAETPAFIKAFKILNDKLK